MSDYINYYGREATGDWQGLDFMGYAYFGPIQIPPVITTFGMTDRAGTGVVWFLMWDGEDHLVLTNQPPLAFAQAQGSNWGVTAPYGQNVSVFGPWDGPYFANWRLGVSTAAATDGSGNTHGAGTPRLQFDTPDPYAGAPVHNSGGPPWIAPDINGPATESFPEPSNFPSPQPGVIPTIPSTSPPPTGGGFTAFLAAYTTNTPPLILPGQIALGTPGLGLKIVQPWHLQHFGG